MCGDAASDPSQHAAPEPQRPRIYELAGERQEPRGSVALAVLGELIQQAEDREWVYSADALTVLHEARIRIAAAEAAL